MKLLTSILLISIFCCSCNKSWQYRIKSIKKAVVLNQSVAVLPFRDRRSRENTNLAALSALPLLPYGWQNMNSPEMVSGHAHTGAWYYNPKENFAMALAEELDEAGVFKEAVFVHYRGMAKESKYIVRGSLIKSRYNSKIYTYFISYFAFFPWLLGAPATYTYSDLEIEFSLIRTADQKRLFSKKYAAKPISSHHWIYNLKNDFVYDQLLQDINQQFIADLREKLR